MKKYFPHFKRSLLLAALTTACIHSGNADIISHPDANTLWHEDGTSAPTGEVSSSDHWYGTLDIKAENGALQIDATDPKNHSVGRYVKIDPQYPFLTWHIRDCQPHPGYRSFGITLPTGKEYPGFSLVNQINPGIYALDLTPFFTSSAQTSYLRLDLYGAKLTLDNLSMVKTPDNYIEITPQKDEIHMGDDITFTVFLKDAAEDVTLNFYDSYTMPQLKINGQQTLQLKPKDAGQKVWTATLKLQSIENLRGAKDGQLPGFHIITKAVVLGGTLKEPLWTVVPSTIFLQEQTEGNK